MNCKDDISKQREESLTISYHNVSKDLMLFPSSNKPSNKESTKLYSNLNSNNNPNNHLNNVSKFGYNVKNFLHNDSNNKITNMNNNNVSNINNKESNPITFINDENKNNNNNNNKNNNDDFYDEINNQVNFTYRKSSSKSSSGSDKIDKDNNYVMKNNNYHNHEGKNNNNNFDKKNNYITNTRNISVSNYLQNENNNKTNNNYDQLIMNTLRSCESDRNLITENDKVNMNNNNNKNKQKSSNSLFDLSKNVEEIKIKRPKVYLSDKKLFEVAKQDDKNLVDSIFYNDNKNHISFDKSNTQRNFFQAENAFNKLNNHKQKEIYFHSKATHFKPFSKFSNNSSENSVSDSFSNRESNPEIKESTLHPKINKKSTTKNEMGWKTKVNMQLHLENFATTNKNFRKLIPLKNVYDSVSDNEAEDDSNKTLKATNESHLLRKIWNYFILFSIVYSASYGIFHNTVFPNDTESFLFPFEILVELCFLVDIVINFFTPYNENNKIYYDKKSIALNYLRNWLPWDLVSSMPLSIVLYFNKQSVSESILNLYLLGSYNNNQNINSIKNGIYISNSEKGISSAAQKSIFLQSENYLSANFQKHFNAEITENLISNNFYFQTFRWLRAIKLFKLFSADKNTHLSNEWNINKKYKSSGYVRLSLIFLFLIHISTCLWIFIGGLDDSETRLSWFKNLNNYWKMNAFDIYVSSLYFNLLTIYTVGYGDIISKNNNERLYNIFILMFGNLLFSFGISYLSFLFASSNILENKFKHKMNVLEKLRKKYEVPKNLYRQIKRSIKNMYTKVHMEKFVIFDSLPLVLKREFILSMHKKGISNLIFFKFSDKEFIIAVLPLLKTHNLLKDDILISAGGIIEEIYLVNNGILSICLDSSFNNIQISQLKRNFHFGDILIYLNEKTPYTLKCSTKSAEYLTISKSDYYKIGLTFDKIVMKILEFSCEFLENIEITKQVIVGLFDEGKNSNEIKLLIKTINYYISKMDFENIYYGEGNVSELLSVEDFFAYNDILDIIKFSHTNMNERNFKRIFGKFLNEENYYLESYGNTYFKTKSKSLLKEHGLNVENYSDAVVKGKKTISDNNLIMINDNYLDENYNYDRINNNDYNYKNIDNSNIDNCIIEDNQNLKNFNNKNNEDLIFNKFENTNSNKSYLKESLKRDNENIKLSNTKILNPLKNTEMNIQKKNTRKLSQGTGLAKKIKPIRRASHFYREKLNDIGNKLKKSNENQNNKSNENINFFFDKKLINENETTIIKPKKKSSGTSIKNSSINQKYIKANNVFKQESNTQLVFKELDIKDEEKNIEKKVLNMGNFLMKNVGKQKNKFNNNNNVNNNNNNNINYLTNNKNTNLNLNLNLSLESIQESVDNKNSADFSFSGPELSANEISRFNDENNFKAKNKNFSFSKSASKEADNSFENNNINNNSNSILKRNKSRKRSKFSRNSNSIIKNNNNNEYDFNIELKSNSNPRKISKIKHSIKKESRRFSSRIFKSDSENSQLAKNFGKKKSSKTNKNLNYNFNNNNYHTKNNNNIPKSFINEKNLDGINNQYENQENDKDCVSMKRPTRALSEKDKMLEIRNTNIPRVSRMNIEAEPRTFVEYKNFILENIEKKQRYYKVVDNFKKFVKEKIDELQNKKNIINENLNNSDSFNSNKINANNINDLAAEEIKEIQNKNENNDIDKEFNYKTDNKNNKISFKLNFNNLDEISKPNSQRNKSNRSNKKENSNRKLISNQKRNKRCLSLSESKQKFNNLILQKSKLNFKLDIKNQIKDNDEINVNNINFNNKLNNKLDFDSEEDYSLIKICKSFSINTKPNRIASEVKKIINENSKYESIFNFNNNINNNSLPISSKRSKKNTHREKSLGNKPDIFKDKAKEKDSEKELISANENKTEINNKNNSSTKLTEENDNTFIKSCAAENNKGINERPQKEAGKLNSNFQAISQEINSADFPSFPQMSKKESLANVQKEQLKRFYSYNNIKNSENNLDKNNLKNEKTNEDFSSLGKKNNLNMFKMSPEKKRNLESFKTKRKNRSEIFNSHLSDLSNSCNVNKNALEKSKKNLSKVSPLKKQTSIIDHLHSNREREFSILKHKKFTLEDLNFDKVYSYEIIKGNIFIDYLVPQKNNIFFQNSISNNYNVHNDFNNIGIKFSNNSNKYQNNNSNDSINGTSYFNNACFSNDKNSEKVRIKSKKNSAQQEQNMQENINFNNNNNKKIDLVKFNNNNYKQSSNINLSNGRKDKQKAKSKIHQSLISFKKSDLFNFDKLKNKNIEGINNENIENFKKQIGNSSSENTFAATINNNNNNNNINNNQFESNTNQMKNNIESGIRNKFKTKLFIKDQLKSLFDSNHDNNNNNNNNNISNNQIQATNNNNIVNINIKNKQKNTNFITVINNNSSSDFTSQSAKNISNFVIQEKIGNFSNKVLSKYNTGLSGFNFNRNLFSKNLTSLSNNDNNNNADQINSQKDSPKKHREYRGKLKKAKNNDNNNDNDHNEDLSNNNILNNFKNMLNKKTNEIKQTQMINKFALFDDSFLENIEEDENSILDNYSNKNSAKISEVKNNLKSGDNKVNIYNKKSIGYSIDNKNKSKNEKEAVEKINSRIDNILRLLEKYKK